MGDFLSPSKKERNYFRPFDESGAIADWDDSCESGHCGLRVWLSVNDQISR